MKQKLILLPIMLLAACSPEPNLSMSESATLQNPESRFKVDRVAVFTDGLAYGDRRGIYLITDSKTKTEFIGISGIGISELGSHSQYNASTETTTFYPDER